MCAKKWKRILGIDVGASGIKGAVVNLSDGTFESDRIKFLTPQPAKPSAVAKTIKALAKEFKWKKGNAVGIGVPAVVVNGRTRSAANISDAWINLKAEEYLSEKTGYRVTLVNDADAAGIAALRFGHVKNTEGTVILLTIGTGIGSALFYNGMLIPNTEFGHMPYKRSVAENYVSNRARKDRGLSIKKWASELNVYLAHVNTILRPDLIVLSGGISKRFGEYKSYLKPGCKVVASKMLNDAGIIGAAVLAAECKKS